MDREKTSRRAFLKMGLAAGATLVPGVSAALSPLFCPPAIGADGRRLADDEIRIVSRGVYPVDRTTPAAPALADGPGARRLRLGRNRFGETYDAVCFANGRYVDRALDEFTHYCRDGYNKAMPMDPGVMDLIRHLGEALEIGSPFNVNSAYRSPAYNRKTGGKRNSLHLKGKALDIWHPAIQPSSVQRAAEGLRVGGVGRYRGFTHIDTGRVRYWRG